jgi:hypothetical protein
MVVRPRIETTCKLEKAGGLILEEEVRTFMCSVCEKERKISGAELRRRVSYIESGEPNSERPICFNCIRRLVKEMSNAKR